MLSAAPCTGREELAGALGALWASCNREPGCLFASCWWLFPLVRFCVFLGSLYYQLCNLSPRVSPTSSETGTEGNNLSVWRVSHQIIEWPKTGQQPARANESILWFPGVLGNKSKWAALKFTFWYLTQIKQCQPSPLLLLRWQTNGGFALLSSLLCVLASVLPL